MSKQSPKHELYVSAEPFKIIGTVALIIFLVLMVFLAACVSTPQQAREINDLSIGKLCTVIKPVTDVTSSQVRANNRARYSLCATLEKTK